MELRVVFASLDAELLAELERLAVRDPDRFEVREISALDAGCDAILCPTNAFGFLDGGVALQICERFGWRLQEEFRRTIRDEHHGELLVGQARILGTGGDRPHAVVFAPVARTPGDLRRTVNVYLAVRGALLAIRAHNREAERPITSLAVPPLGREFGRLSAFAERRQIKHALDRILREKPAKYPNLSKAIRREKRLKRQVPRSEREASGDAGDRRTGPEGAAL